MTLKGNVIFNEKFTVGLKNDIRNLINFHASSRKPENLHFDGLQSIQSFRSKRTEELCLMTLKSDPKKFAFFV